MSIILPSFMASPSPTDMTTETARRDLQQTMELPSAISQSQQEDLLNISGGWTLILRQGCKNKPVCNNSVPPSGALTTTP